MVDHRHSLGESGRGYPCYVLQPPKIALVAVSGTRSSAAVDGFSGAQPSTGCQVHGRRRVFRCTAIDEFSGAWSPLTRLRTYGINHYPVAAAVLHRTPVT